MSITSKPNTFTNGTTADATLVNANFDALYNDYNGNITDANIAAGGITTYGKVNGSAISSLGSISASAGTIPTANLPSIPTKSSQAQAEAAADDTTFMTPLQVKNEVQKSGAVSIPYANVAGLGGGATETKTNATVYQAATDGFAFTVDGGSGAGVVGVDLYVGDANPPTTLTSTARIPSNTPYGGSTFGFVKKGRYWKTTGAANVYWLPLGS